MQTCVCNRPAIRAKRCSQTLIACGTAGTCLGGDSNAANAWVHAAGGIPDVTCQQYQAKNMNCSAERTCMNCAGAPCFAVANFPKVQITEYGSVVGDDQIMAEVYARGPVSCCECRPHPCATEKRLSSAAPRRPQGQQGTLNWRPAKLGSKAVGSVKGPGVRCAS